MHSEGEEGGGRYGESKHAWTSNPRVGEELEGRGGRKGGRAISTASSILLEHGPAVCRLVIYGGTSDTAPHRGIFLVR